MRVAMRKASFVSGVIMLAVCMLLPVIACADSGTGSGGKVSICLQEEIPGNEPYRKDSRQYNRDLAVPLLNGKRGYLYKKNGSSRKVRE